MIFTLPCCRIYCRLRQIETNLKPIPVNLITGFLGTGKTTGISSLLRQRPPHEHWAVLINDFGQTSIDPTKFQNGAGVTVREVPGGCPCCTAQVQMRVTLTRLLREVKPIRLLIEPSSLGHLAAFIDLLRDQWLVQALTLRATCCMIDPRQFADPRYFSSPIYQEQLSAADVLIVNQNDLVTPNQMDAFIAFADQIQPPKLRAVKTALDAACLDWDPSRDAEIPEGMT